MFEMIRNGGLIGQLIIIMGITSLILAVRAWQRAKAGEFNVESTRKALLFWGVVALALGILGHTMGLFNALSVITANPDRKIEGAAVLSAFEVSMIPVIFGFVVLLTAGVCWFVLGQLKPTSSNN